MAEGSKAGRPPKYKSVGEISEKIEEYFEKCEKGKKPLTVTGLALALGFQSRQALLNYQGRKEFSAAIIRAKSRVEQYTEERLFDKEGANGAKFSLANNFDGWKDKKEVDADFNRKININLEMSDDE